MSKDAVREYEICAGSYVLNSHGDHILNYLGIISFYCRAEQLDSVGRVIDFGDIKTKLCDWVEENWDHKMLIFDQDPWAKILKETDSTVVLVPFNPTAENLAEYLLTEIGPAQLFDTNVELVKVKFEETRKCWVEVSE